MAVPTKMIKTLRISRLPAEIRTMPPPRTKLRSFTARANLYGITPCRQVVVTTSSENLLPPYSAATEMIISHEDKLTA